MEGGQKGEKQENAILEKDVKDEKVDALKTPRD